MVKTVVRISGWGGAATRPAQVHILLAWLLPAVLPNGNAPDGTRRHEGPETAPSSWTNKIAPDARAHNPPVDGSSPSRPTPPDQGVCFRPRVPGASRGRFANGL